MTFLRQRGRGVGRPGVVAGIEVVRLRRQLRGQGVDLCQVRSDAQPLALGADAARRRLGELADLAVGEAQLLGLAQGGLVEWAATSAAARGASGRWARWRGGTRGRCA